MGTPSECEKRTVLTTAKNIAKGAGRAVWKIICNQLKQLVATIVGLLQVELQVVVPVVNLAAIFVENFVLFPLDAAANTAASLDKNVATPFVQAGFDSGCHKYKNVNERIAKATRPIKSLRQDLENLRDSAQVFVDEVHELEKNITDAIESLNFITDNITCP